MEYKVRFRRKFPEFLCGLLVKEGVIDAERATLSKGYSEGKEGKKNWHYLIRERRANCVSMGGALIAATIYPGFFSYRVKMPENIPMAEDVVNRILDKIGYKNI